MKTIAQEINKTSLEKSNLDLYIDKSLELSCNLHKIWELGNYSEKQQLQNLLFPNGIIYSREKDSCRTTKATSVLELIISDFKQKEKGTKKQKC